MNIQTIQRPTTIISKYFPLKDPIPKLLKSKVVYKLKCSDCEATYIGKTMRHAKKRLQEHRADIFHGNEIESHSNDITENLTNLRQSKRNKRKIVNYFPKTPV
jgi:hypothetical protein